VDVSKLDVGDALHVGEITLPEGARLADEDEADVTIATVSVQKEEEVEVAPAEGPAEPEIIGRKAEESAEEGEEAAME
jgi:large subunit ribosomal protein L25